MKLGFKFFIWKIQVKTKRLGAEEKVKFLANELIKNIQECGYSIQNASIAKDFGSLNIGVHRYSAEDVVMYIENMSNNWKIETKPNFKLLEADK